MAEPETAALQEQPGYVYFIRARYPRTNALIKVGWGQDPRKRLKDLQIGSPVELDLIGAIPGTRKDEKACHERWNLYRRHGEWFLLNAEMHELLLERGEMVAPEIQRHRENRAWFAARENAGDQSSEDTSPTERAEASRP